MRTRGSAGDLLDYNFGPSWSPRMGINIDPMGDQRTKIFFNFGRNYWAMPLDAAIRQLGNEQDDTSYLLRSRGRVGRVDHDRPGCRHTL